MKKIGIISDTHGTFDGTLREFLKDVDEIWHAGDIGSLELADAIAAFKPLRAVSGNIDGGLTRRVYPDFLSFECEGVRVLMEPLRQNAWKNLHSMTLHGIHCIPSGCFGPYCI